MLAEFQKQLSQTLEEIKSQGLFETERIITTPQDAHIAVAGGKRVINMCANNYLGLADHPELIKAAKAALDTHGLGMASVRFICGTQDLHKELEAALTKFLGTEETILYPSAFDANGGLFETILTEKDAVISDELNHASIIDGIRLCKAQRYRYKHNDMADLEAKLKEARGGFNSARKEIVDLLRQRSRPYLFSNTVAPPIVAAVLKALELLTKSTELRDKLETNTKYFRDAVTKAGLTIKPGVHPIVPIM